MHSNVTSKNVSGFTLAGPPCIYSQVRRGQGHVTYFKYIGTILIVGNGEGMHFMFCIHCVAYSSSLSTKIWCADCSRQVL